MGYMEETDITCIAQTMERYISFKIGKHIEFKDSFLFMSSSLEKLTQNLRARGEEFFTNLISEYPNDYLLLLRKGVFPYDFFDGPNKLRYRELPTKDEFYSQLYDEHVSDEDYEHAQRVWQHFNMQELEEYVRLYCVSDTLQLSDVFENFRTTCLESYGLDPCHFYGM